MYGVDSTVVAVTLDMARSGEILCVPRFNSERKSWFIFVTGSDNLTNQIDHSDVQHYEPNHNVNQDDYKKVS